MKPTPTLLLPFFLLAAAPASAKTIEVPDDHATIQAAIDAAQPGDTIEVDHGTYAERIVVPAALAGLKIEGSSRTVLEDLILLDTPVIRIEAPGVEIENVTVRHVLGLGTRSAIEVAAPDVTLRELALFSIDGDAIESSGADRLRLDEIEFVGVDGFATSLSGDDVVVTDCEVRGADSGIEVTGARASVEENDVHCRFGTGVRVDGDDASVRENTIECRYGDGIEVDGARSSVKENDVTLAFSGIRVFGQDAVVSRNTVSRTDNYGIQLSGSGSVITKNEITDAGFAGLSVYSALVKIRKNEIRSCGDIGIEVGGNAHTVESNEVRDGLGDGIQVFGETILLTGNEVIGHAHDGIAVFGASTTIVDNDVRKNRAEGLDNRASGTTVIDNRFKKNRIDVATTKPFAEFEENEFKTGGPETLPEV